MTQTMTVPQTKPIDPQVAQDPTGAPGESDTLREVEAWGAASREARERCDKQDAETQMKNRAQRSAQ